MSLFVAGTLVISLLCYNATADIGAGEFLKQAQIFNAELTSISEAGESGCIDIKSQRALEEARRLVEADASQETLSIKQ